MRSRPSGGDESVDVVFDASPESLGAVEQGRSKSSEAIDAESIPAIEVATELDVSADVLLLRFVSKYKENQTNLNPAYKSQVFKFEFV